MKRILLITAAVAALGAAPAQAAPDYNGTLDATTTSFTWDGSGSGITDPFGEFVTCEQADVHQCDDILLKVDAGGDLTVTIDNTSPTGVEVPDPVLGGNIVQFQDLDMNIYKSNAAGEPEGETLTEDGATTLISETATVKNVKPGFYLARIDYYLAFEATYTGTATLTNVVQPPTVVQAVTETAPTETAPPPPPAVAAPAPAAAPKTSTAAARKKALAKCRAKAKKIKKAKKRKKALKRCAAKAKRA